VRWKSPARCIDPMKPNRPFPSRCGIFNDRPGTKRSNHQIISKRNETLR
jgi:hypothetical protein